MSWPIAMAVVMATLAVAGWSAWSMGAAPGAAPAAAPTSPAALEQDLLRQNVRQPGDPRLDAMYAEINARYYAGTLPSMPVRWEPGLSDVGALAQNRFTLEGMFGHLGSDAVILLDPSLQSDPAALARALCHEIVHAWLYTTGDRSTDHGPAFQAELRRLAGAGAFEGTPASDADRATLHTWLDAESARLDDERQTMDGIGADLEREHGVIDRALADLKTSAGDAAVQPDAIARLSSRRDAYNQRAADANARIDRDRADLDRFNQAVARYNLMLVYPDGMDEADLIKTKPVSPGTRSQ